MAVPICRVGDSGSHGGAYIGSITTGVTNTFDNGVEIAVVGCIYSCPTHGSQTIIIGSTEVFIGSNGVARIGDTISCGAILDTGDSNFQIV